MLLSNNIGTSLDDLTCNYTVDQVYLLYEKINKIQLENYRMNAIIGSQALIYASPSYSQSDSSKKSTQWKKFIDSLDWDSVKSKSQGSNDGLKALVNIVMMKKGDKI